LAATARRIVAFLMAAMLFVPRFARIDFTAGDGSTLSASSRARTCTVWSPRATGENVFGLVQGTNGPESSLHSKVRFAADVWLSLPVNAYVTDCLPPLDDVIVVSGATSSDGTPSEAHVSVNEPMSPQ